jgi:hypothetical protein
LLLFLCDGGDGTENDPKPLDNESYRTTFPLSLGADGRAAKDEGQNHERQMNDEGRIANGK